MKKEQLISEFAAKYLKEKGLTPEDFLDNSGNYKEEYVKHLTDLMTSLSTDEFWDSYQQNPDETVKQVVAQEEEQVTMAKKGAKLKQLKSATKKCKCGCNMVDFKEAGGKMSSKCSCNCSGGKMPKKEKGGLIQKFAGGSVFNYGGNAVINPAIENWANKPLYHGRPGAVINTQLNPFQGVSDWFKGRINETRVSTQGPSLIRPNPTTPTSPNTPGKPLSIYDIPSRGQEDYSGGMSETIKGRAQGWRDKLTNPQIYNPIEIMAGEAIHKQPAIKQGQGESIVDYLKAKGQDSSILSRKKLAEQLGINNYIGSAEQNMTLLQLLKNQHTRDLAVAQNNPTSMFLQPKGFPTFKKGGSVSKKQSGGEQNMADAVAKPKVNFIPKNKANLKTPVYKKDNIKLKVKK